MNSLHIGIYDPSVAIFLDYDPRSPEVAAMIAAAVQNRQPRAQVDHIGSTAIPGCRGKGIIDLAVTYAAGDLEITKAALDSLGFQRQTGRDPFPETRPMRVGSLQAFGATYRIHAHVIERDGEEHRGLIRFRNAMRADPALREAYESAKQSILARGITDSLEYCYAKEAFITQVLSKLA